MLELRDRLRILKRKEEEYDLLKEELAKKKGELEATQVYIRHIDKLDERLSKLLKTMGRENEGEDRFVP